MFRISDRRARVISLATVLVASSLAVIGGSPATAGTGSNLYDLTCGGNIAGQNTGPVPTPIQITSTTISPDPAFPQGDAVQVTGDVAVTVLGALQAGILATLPGNSLQITAGSSVEVRATNTTSANTVVDLSGPAVAMNGRVIAGGIAFAAGGTTVTSPSGSFLATDVGSAIATSATAGPGLAAGTVIIGFTSANTVTISTAALAAATAAQAAVANNTVFTKTAVNLGSYNSNGTSGGNMEFSLAVGPATGLNLALNGLPGTFNQTNPWGLPSPPNPPAGCFLLGAGSPFGPSPIPGAAFAPFGSAALIDPPPIPASQTLNVGTSTVTPITLTAADGDATPPSSFTIQSLPAAGTLTVSGVPAVIGTPYSGSSLATVYTAGATASVQSFTFSASDGVTSSATNATITLNVGSPPVQQDISQEITPGQLVISCNWPPSAAGFPASDCAPIAFPSVELDGTNQSNNRPMSQVHVSDNRGDVTAGWSLTSYLIDQPITGGGTFKGLVNTNAGADTSLPANRIEASYLSVGAISCAAVSPAPATVATTGAGGNYSVNQALCSAAAGTSIGHFTVDGTFTLTAPSSKAAGNYSGTVEYLVI